MGSDPSHLTLAVESECSPGKLRPFVVCVLCNTLRSSLCKIDGACSGVRRQRCWLCEGLLLGMPGQK